MKYLSLFSGIGGFEHAILKEYPDAKCVAFSEIDPYAIKIYEKHFPTHKNLGDITKIKKGDLDEIKCDLVVGGFPCTNLSSMSNIRGNSNGLQGPKSGLFYEMVRILEYVVENNPNVKFIIENNFSMKKENRKMIMDVLSNKFENIHSQMIDNSLLGVQSRKRIIWSNFEVPPLEKSVSQQSWDDILAPIESTEKYNLTEKMVNCLNKLVPYSNSKGTTKIARSIGNGRYIFDELETTDSRSRWDIQSRSDTMDTQIYTPYPVGKSRPITAGSGGGNNVVLDRRGGEGFVPRNFTPLEVERLFGLPDYYTQVKGLSDTRRKRALGNSVPIFVVHYVIKHLKPKK